MKLCRSEWLIFIFIVILFGVSLGLMIYTNVVCIICNMQCSNRTNNMILSLIFLFMGIIQIAVFIMVRKQRLKKKHSIYTDKEKQIECPKKEEVSTCTVHEYNYCPYRPPYNRYAVFTNSGMQCSWLNRFWKLDLLKCLFRPTWTVYKRTVYDGLYNHDTNIHVTCIFTEL